MILREMILDLEVVIGVLVMEVDKVADEVTDMEVDKVTDNTKYLLKTWVTWFWQLVILTEIMLEIGRHVELIQVAPPVG